MTLSAIPSGLYDLLITERLERLLAADASARHRAQPLTEDAAAIIADTLVRQLGALLDDLPGEGAEAAQRQLALVNEMLVWLRQRLQAPAHTGSARAHIDLLAPPARLLRAVHRTPASPTPPELGLAAPWLFTAGKGSPSLLQEIRRELASSDRVDIIVSFTTVSGVRESQDVLQRITAHGAEAALRQLLNIDLASPTCGVAYISVVRLWLRARPADRSSTNGMRDTRVTGPSTIAPVQAVNTEPTLPKSACLDHHLESQLPAVNRIRDGGSYKPRPLGGEL